MENQRKYKIIVVDDEPDVAELVGNYFMKCYEVDAACASNGAMAVELARKMSPDLILLDINMPGLTGWDVIRKIREFDDKVKIIIISGYSFDEVGDQECIKLARDQVSAFLHKPMRLESLCDKVMEVLGEGPKKAERPFADERIKEPSKGGDSIHDIASMLFRIRLKAECFYSDYEDGFCGQKSDKELLAEAIAILKDNVAVVNEINEAIERIRKQ